jgi:TldD protein
LAVTVSQTRRGFVQLSAAALALATIGRGARGEELTRGIGSGASGIEDPSAAREVALAALDAARGAGATYADVRVDAELSQSFAVWHGRSAGPANYSDRFVYGVRVLANGQWGFAGDPDPSPNAVAQCARRAVAQAVAASRDRRPAVVLASAPVVRDGTWSTPIEIDPFSVPIGDQQEEMLTAIRAARGVRGISDVGCDLSFRRIVRTFASTEGSFVVQSLAFAYPSAEAYASAADDPGFTVRRRAAGFRAAQRGYEIVRDARLPERLVAAAEAAVLATRARPIDVGRYDVVVSASVMASLVAETLGAATGLDRASSREVAVSGSFAAPPKAALGRPIAASVLSVACDRSLSAGLATVGWDDEGVAPETFPLIERGTLVDYQTTRASAPELAWWYARRGGVVRSHGCAVGGGMTVPREAMPNLAIAPAATDVSVAELIAGVRRGIYFSEDGIGGSDDRSGTGQWSASAAQEIRDGKLVGYVRDAAMQFQVAELWQSLDAIGGTKAIEQVAMGRATVRAVPGRFRRVNVVNTGSIV